MNKLGLMVREEEGCCEVLNRRGLRRLQAPSDCSVKRELESESSVVGSGAVAETSQKRGSWARQWQPRSQESVTR